MANRKSYISILCIIMTILLASSAMAITTFTAQETEMLTLTVDTIDLDGDDITYTYSEPFDENGEWLTEYEDAGEYTITITASDGLETVTKYVKVVVEETNREPYLSENSLTFYEQDEIDLTEYVIDPDNDVLIYSFSEPFSEDGTWTPGFDDAGRYVIEVEATDGDLSISRLMEVVIEETNQAPEIDDSFSDEFELTIAEGETMEFWVDATDGDGDSLTITWNFDGEGNAVGESGELEFDYDTEGEYEFSVTVGDGEYDVTRTWTIIVENTNRAPEFDTYEYNYVVSEGETITILEDFESEDQDGDSLSYEFGTPFNENGEWEIDYESAGSFEVNVVASDGEFEVDLTIIVEVEDTDRAPEASYVLETSNFAEGDEFTLEITTSDPDGDDVTVEILEAPEEMELESSGSGEIHTLMWDISYDTIQREENFLTNILNALRLEQTLLKEKSETIELQICGSEECTEETITIYIQNINQAPEFVEYYNQGAVETDFVEPYVSATDADGDILKYYFSEPLSEDGTWQTGYEDEGEYTVTITASDGYLTTSEEITIVVEKLNREPSIWADKGSYTVLEGEKLQFWIDGSDEDTEDELTITLTNSPDGATFSDQTFTWTPDHDTVTEASWGLWNKLISGSEVLTKLFSSDETTTWLEFVVTDGEVEVIMPIEVVIKNVNQAPEIVSTTPSDVQNEADAGDEVEFAVEAADADGDELEYKWSFSGFDYETVQGTDHISRVFTSDGEKRVTVEVSDGLETVEHSWIIDVTGTVTTTTKATTSSSSSSSSSSSGSGDSDDDSDPTYAVYVVEDWK